MQLRETYRECEQPSLMCPGATGDNSKQESAPSAVVNTAGSAREGHDSVAVSGKVCGPSQVRQQQFVRCEPCSRRRDSVS
jgi:hypothetical protein